MKLFMLSASIALALCACDRTEPTTSSTAATTATTATPAKVSISAPRVPSGAGVAARPTCPPQSDDAFFFPVATLGRRTARFDQDLFQQKVYSAQLRKMLEPSLSCGGSLQGVFRFTWLRSFHAPIAIRVSVAGTSAMLAATQMSGSGGYAPNAVVDQPRRELSLNEWKGVEEVLAQSNFWALPSWRDDGDPDGAQWIIEGRVGSRYHVVDRWSPQPGSFRDIGVLFIKLSRLSIPERHVY